MEKSTHRLVHSKTSILRALINAVASLERMDNVTWISVSVPVTLLRKHPWIQRFPKSVSIIIQNGKFVCLG